MSASIHVPATAVATPVYSLQDEGTHYNGNNATGKSNKIISEYWVGILDLGSIQKSIKNLNLTNDQRIIVVDHNGTAIVDFSHSSNSSAANDSNNNNNVSSLSKLKDISYLNSVKAVIKGKAGSIFETVNGTMVLTIYQPVQVGSRFWGVIILIEPVHHHR